MVSNVEDLLNAHVERENRHMESHTVEWHYTPGEVASTTAPDMTGRLSFPSILAIQGDWSQL
jgi:hypothetical protein